MTDVTPLLIAYFTVSVIPIPSSSFTANITKGCPPVKIDLTANPYNTAFSYSWNLGNGQSAVGYSTSVTYTSAGYYNVSLTVSNRACTSTSTYTNYIHIFKCILIQLLILLRIHG